MARLSAPVVESGDVTEYQLLMTPEQAAALEAAIGPLSAPAPNEETGGADLRPAGQRPGGGAHPRCAAAPPRSTPTARAQMGRHPRRRRARDDRADRPEARTGCGEVLGSTATGTILSPEVLRRVACDAALVPHVLGSAGEDLDRVGGVRLFTRAQRRRLWRRDRGCTYPGAPHRRRGLARITCGTGPTAAPPTSTTPPCSASGTTPGAPATPVGAGQRATRRARPVRGVGPPRRRLRPPPRGASNARRTTRRR